MKKDTFASISKANAAFEAIAATVDPALAKAKVLTISVEGKPVPVSEAPISARVAAALALVPAAEGQQDLNELMVTNSQVAAQNEKLSSDLATATATVGGLQSEKGAAISRAEAAEASVQTLTAEKAQLDVQVKAAQAEFSRVNNLFNALNTELSEQCIKAGCLDLKDANGQPLKATSTAAEKLSAANLIPAQDKLKAFNGAVNAAIARVGIQTETIPSSGGTAANTNTLAENGLLNKLNATTDPVERTNLRRKNWNAIRSGFKSNSN